MKITHSLLCFGKEIAQVQFSIASTLGELQSPLKLNNCLGELFTFDIACPFCEEAFYFQIITFLRYLKFFYCPFIIPRLAQHKSQKIMRLIVSLVDFKCI